MARPLRPLAPAVYIGIGARARRRGEGRRRLDARRRARDLPARVRAERRRQDARAVDRRDRRDRARRGLDRLRARPHPPAARAAGQGAAARRSPCSSPSGRPTRSRTSRAGSSAATSSRRRSRPGKTWEGFVVGSLAGIFASFIALYDTRDTYLTSWQAVVLGLVVVLAAAAGDLFESMLKRDMEVKDTGRLLGATAACSTGSTRCSSPRWPRSTSCSPSAIPDAPPSGTNTGAWSGPGTGVAAGGHARGRDDPSGAVPARSLHWPREAGRPSRRHRLDRASGDRDRRRASGASSSAPSPRARRRSTTSTRRSSRSAAT